MEAPFPNLPEWACARAAGFAREPRTALARLAGHRTRGPDRPLHSPCSIHAPMPHCASLMARE
ncbi:hypothetical protein GCM10007320_56050 [Pseudorhodoferax aquiterrae]|uniref:Uncharacterized protein n=1 Tax=Pseudorhodoferax aquiterrae TaxID=747304 RepID=A0ABQ3GAF1_9BURK|nr:hypothetical protein GCM10007320_56050 [Pseudorhodoferax aquiterrae]